MKNDIEKKNYNKVLLILTLAIVGVILYFGLTPKNYPISNNIQWLPETKGLRFLNPSLAYLDDLGSLRAQISDEFTLSITVAVAAVDTQGFKPIIMIHDGNDQSQFSISQWGASLVIMNADDYDYSRKAPRISALDVLKGGRKVEIVLTSGHTGTSLFLDRQLVKEDSKLRLLIPRNGEKIRLVLGNSVYGKHNWEGEISSLAFYGKALSEKEVTQRVEQSSEGVYSSKKEETDLLLLYTFDQKEGTVIRDRSGYGHDLQIPRRFVVLKKAILSWPHHNFPLKRWFIIDVTLNFIGFIPLGGVLVLWVLLSKPMSYIHAGLMVLAICFSLSLSIEIAQVWLPNRVSSILDVALNTLGALAGILLVSIVFRHHPSNRTTNHRSAHPSE